MERGTCQNCGGSEGIHHCQTSQCPVGGREATGDRKQEYKTSTYVAPLLECSRCEAHAKIAKEARAVIEAFMSLSGKRYRTSPNRLLTALDAMLPNAQRVALELTGEDA